jgi:hypothetical protein
LHRKIPAARLLWLGSLVLERLWWINNFLDHLGGKKKKGVIYIANLI